MITFTYEGKSDTTRLVQNLATTSNATMVIPAGFMILDLVIKSTNANAVTGGLKIGTTNGGTDVVLAVNVAGNSYQVVTDAAMLKRVFSDSVDTTLYVQAVTLWNSASLDIKFVLRDIR